MEPLLSLFQRLKVPECLGNSATLGTDRKCEGKINFTVVSGGNFQDRA
jgi:hypothetical protein